MLPIQLVTVSDNQSPAHMKLQNEYHIMIMLSQKCNLACTYCFSYNNKREESNNIYMFYQLLLTNIYEYLDINPQTRIIKFEFFGGEPLIKFEEIKKLTQLLKKSLTFCNLKFVMPTNGLLLTKEMIDWLSDNNFKISISFDGKWDIIQRPQDIKNNSSKKKQPNKSIIKYANQRGILDHIHCMVHPIGITQNTILDNYLFFKKHFKSIKIEMELIKDNNVWVDATLEELNEQLIEFLIFWNNDKQTEVPLLLEKPILNIINYQLKQIKAPSCGVLETRTLIDPELNFYPCNHLKHIDKEQYLKAYYNEKCLTCEIEPYCNRGCPIQMFLPSTNRKKDGQFYFYESENYLCKLFKILHKHASNLIYFSQVNPKSNIAQIIKKLIKNEGI